MESFATSLHDLLISLTEICVPLIDLIALAVLAFGTIEAAVSATAAAFTPKDTHRRRMVWLRYSNWLVAGLTFQLAADIIETSAAPSWDDLARLAAIAVIRTFLNYFLERDQTEARAQLRETDAPMKAAP